MECEAFFEGEGGDLVASTPVTIRITPLSKIKAYGFWVLPLLLLAWKPNRSRKALWILVPYYLWLLLQSGIASLMWFGEIAGLAPPVLATLCGLFLLAPLVRRWNGWLVLLGAIAFTLGVHLAWGWMNRVEHWLYLGIVSSVLCVVMLVSAALARRCCRGVLRRVRLALCLLPAVVLVTLVGLMATALGFLVSFGEMGITMASALASVLIPGLIVGLILYMVLLSFLIVPFATVFYRERLGLLLKLKLPEPPASPAG